jgi:hypothetical protein
MSGLLTKPLYRPGMTSEERKAADTKFERLMDLVAEKLKYLPEKHKADIRRFLEGL